MGIKQCYVFTVLTNFINIDNDDDPNVSHILLKFIIIK